MAKVDEYQYFRGMNAARAAIKDSHGCTTAGPAERMFTAAKRVLEEKEVRGIKVDFSYCKGIIYFFELYQKNRGKVA